MIGLSCIFHGAADKAISPSQISLPNSLTDAKAVCEVLGIAHEVLDCSTTFDETVVTPFVKAYETGLTPNPCVSCNATCKIPALMKFADGLACESIATGHYARVTQLPENGRFAVKTALDIKKDQSYALALLSQAQLARLVLPLGALTKAEARILAADLGLPVADKEESQDICFVEGEYAEFLKSRGVKDNPGDIVNAAGQLLGRHEGLFYYTIGQRKGIGVAADQPYYVIGKRLETKELVVGFHEETTISKLRLGRVNWIAFEKAPPSFECMVKLHYRARPAACCVEVLPDDGAGSLVWVRLASPQPTTAPGQYAVFYRGDCLLGGGAIL
ncbi:MAG: tRNA 2-thiouridine(34) synthase MnmA [Eggerthellaceae bacterium]|nr:tRNA 2-thiouridine(34) synthase MnmA [Eggerthellaceae bacterium]